MQIFGGAVHAPKNCLVDLLCTLPSAIADGYVGRNGCKEVVLVFFRTFENFVNMNALKFGQEKNYMIQKESFKMAF